MTIGRIQSAVGGADTATSAVGTFSSTAAATGLVFAVFLNSATAPTSITDSAGGTLAGGQWVLRQSTGAWFIYDRLNNPGGITTVTAAFANTTVQWYTTERDDLISFDKTAYTEVGISTTPSSGAVATTSFANEVCFGFHATFSGSGGRSYAASGAWAAEAATGSTAGAWSGASTADSAFVETQILTSTGTPAATATCIASTYNYSTIMTYRQTVSAGGDASGGGDFSRARRRNG